MFLTGPLEVIWVSIKTTWITESLQSPSCLLSVRLFCKGEYYYRYYYYYYYYYHHQFSVDSNKNIQLVYIVKNSF